MKQGSLLSYIAEGWFGGAPSSPPLVAVLRVPLFSASPWKELLRAGACKRERAPGGIQKQREVDGEGGTGRQAAPGMSLLDRQKLDRILLPFLFGLNEQLLFFVSYAGDHRIPNPEAEWQDDGDRIHLSHVCSACGASPAYALLHRGKVQRFPGAPRVSLGSRFPLHRGRGRLFTVQLQGRVARQPHVKDTGDHFVIVVACKGLCLGS